jgi:hypothetical protein
MSKQTVRYTPTHADYIELGMPARVIPVDHPSEMVSNAEFVRTSLVERIGENGEFETRNTSYKPA